MSWALGWSDDWSRDIGYGVPAYCDEPGCEEVIDRGLSYVCCETQVDGGENGCGLHFCGKHRADYRDDDVGPMCVRCAKREPACKAKPDHPMWVSHKLFHPSWKNWRQDNPDKVLVMVEELGTVWQTAKDVTEEYQINTSFTRKAKGA